MCEEVVTTQSSVDEAKRISRAGTPGSPLSSFRFFQFSLEGVLGAVAGLGEIAIGAVLHGVGVAMAELVFHGVVAGLAAFVRFLGTFPAVGIILEMVADTVWHGRPFDVSVNKSMITG